MVNIGVSNDLILEAEHQIGVCFPESLKNVWRISNGLELPGGWQLYPIFDKNSPRKTCNHICYENTKGRWPSMEQSLISIANNGTGNQLVLKKTVTALEDTIYVWNHETGEIKEWSKDFEYLRAIAEARLAKINKVMSRASKNKNSVLKT